MAERDTRRKVLVVSPSLPYPLIWGFGIRVYQMLRWLSLRHHVSLLAYAREEERGAIGALRAEGVCQAVHTVTLPSHLGQRLRLDRAASLLSRESYQTWRLRSPRMQAAICELLTRERFDIVQIESSLMARFRYAGAKALLLDEHNIEYELLQRVYRAERLSARKVFTWLEYLKVRQQEWGAWCGVDGCILTSERERLMLREREPRLPSVVVPNGVDTDFFHPADGPPASNHIVFSGLIRYRPNADAVVYFVREILPLILRDRPDTVFTVVGVGPPPEVKQLAGPNVAITDWVPDVRPYVQRAAVAVVPLRMGSGTRLKVLEGLAMAKAVVSTSLGCEGIAVQDGQHLLVRDRPADFAQAVVRLLAEPEEAVRLGRQGRTLVERAYSWESVVQQLEGFHARCLAQRAG